MSASFLTNDDSGNGSAARPIALQMSSTQDVLLTDASPTLQGYPKGQGRRRKAALLMVVVWGSLFLLHLSSVGIWIIAGLTVCIGAHTLRLLGIDPPSALAPLSPNGTAETYPFISLVVAAKDEEAVIASLVEKLCTLEYPKSRYELWVIDDHSSDRTPLLLADLAQHYVNMNWLRRSADASGGKSGALNQVLPLLKGDLIGVFDADAQVSPDLLLGVVPYFENARIGAVQVRKAIVNADENFWTRGQQVEMVLDAFMQDQRSTAGGIGELRGNGQFVRRVALERCGNWNEETITDDLDLTFRLHLDSWDISSVMFPAVQEEGVTRMMGLWHQRNRWAEGGYQRYLDYWPLLLSNRLGPRKTLDLSVFWTLQYLLPTAAIPDTLLSLWRHHLPLLLPLSSLTMGLSFIGMFAGLNRIRRRQNQALNLIPMTLQALLGTLYMFHWFVVVASVTARLSIRPKRLNWVKTVHVGSAASHVAH